MTVRVLDIRELNRGPVRLTGEWPAGAIDLEVDGVRQSAPLGVDGVAERTGDEVRVHGRCWTSIEAPCSRCLELVAIQVDRAFDLFFFERDSHLIDEDEVELNERDTLASFVDGTEVAIVDILREQVLLSLPMKVLCGAGCQGLCPVCGINRNLQQCSCVQESPHPGTDALVRLKREMEERSSK